jgi:hypothetical protein
MDMMLYNKLHEKLGNDTLSSRWICMPGKIAVGFAKSGSDRTYAAISGRWMLDTWTGASPFKILTGFAPSVSRKGENELAKACNGNCWHEDNVWIDGWSVDLDEVGWKYGHGALPADRKGNGLSMHKRQQIGGTCWLNDPRGWKVLVSLDNMLRLVKSGGLGEDGKLAGQLRYAFSKDALLVVCKDWADSCKNIVDEDVILDVRKEVNSQLKSAPDPVKGKVYKRRSSSLLCIGKLPYQFFMSTLLDAWLLNSARTYIFETPYFKAWMKRNHVYDYVPRDSWQSISPFYSSNPGKCDRPTEALAQLKFPGVTLPWKDAAYKKRVSDVKNALSNERRWTFVDLGTLPTVSGKDEKNCYCCACVAQDWPSDGDTLKWLETKPSTWAMTTSEALVQPSSKRDIIGLPITNTVPKIKLWLSSQQKYGYSSHDTYELEITSDGVETMAKICEERAEFGNKFLAKLEELLPVENIYGSVNNWIEHLADELQNDRLARAIFCR